MSTRALYTFIGEESTGSPHNFNVHKHHDGYPSGAADALKLTVDWFAWKLPRYESDEFAAAFCAAGKAYYLIDALESNEKRKLLLKERGPNGSSREWDGGGVRLMPWGDPTAIAKNNCSDIAYRYEISCLSGVLHVKAFSGSWWDKPSENEIYNGPFDDFFTWANVNEPKKESA